jgi:SAM-dependent methyltransferase
MKKDIRYVPTPFPIVEAILDLANFSSQDTLFDLGSGDGRLVLAAARRGGRGVGVEIDPGLVKRSREQAEGENLSHLSEFRQESFFATDLSSATVIVLYLFHSINTALRPKLLAELRPGSRLISHSFAMEGWPAERRVTVDAKWLYLWTMPADGLIPPQESTAPRSDQESDW